MEAAMISAAATVSVAVITYFVNQQANRRSRQEHLAQEERLKLDAAMRAGELFRGAGPHPATIASGLLALTRLDRADLAVALLVDLWHNPADGTDPPVADETAVLVIDAALRSNRQNAQLIAAELLCRNAPRLNPCQSLHWPSVVDGGWDERFGPKTKLLLIDALMLMTLARPVSEGSLRSIAVRLHGVWSGDHDPRVRGCVGRLIGALVPVLRKLGYADFMQGNQKVLLSQLETAAESGTSNPDGFLDRMVDNRCAQLGAWAAPCANAAPETVRLVEAR